MTSGACTLMNATRSSVPFWISASRAVTVSKPSFSRAERMASITSSRELKIATRGADVRWTSPWSLSRIKNIFYYSYIRCLKTLPSHADAIARSIGGVLGSPRVHSLDLRIRGLGDRSGRVRTFRRVPTTLSGVLGTRLVLRIGRRRSASHRLSRLLVASDHDGNGRNIGGGKLADDA